MNKLQIDIHGKTIECGPLEHHIVQCEHGGEIVEFTLDRYVDGVDLYENTAYSVTGEHMEGDTFVDVISSKVLSGDKLKLTWEVSGNFTRLDGPVTIWLTALKETSSGAKKWSTRPHRIHVEKGMCWSDYIPFEDQFLEAITQMLNEIIEHYNETKDNAEKACECAKRACECAETAELNAGIAEQSAKESVASAESAKVSEESALDSYLKSKRNANIAKESAKIVLSIEETTKQHMLNACECATTALNAVAELPLKLEELLLSTTVFINPTTGLPDLIQSIMYDLYDIRKPAPITAGEYDSLNLTADEFDSYELIRYDYDMFAKDKLV